MSDPTRLIRVSAWVGCMLVLCTLASCAYEGPFEFALKQVFVSEWQANPGSDKRLVLLVELVETRRGRRDEDPGYPKWGFCGEQPSFVQIGFRLSYLQRLPGEGQSNGKSSVELGTEIDHPFFVAIDLKRPRGLENNPMFPDFDLRRDDRDICLQLGAPSIFSVSLSNTVRIPHEAVAGALRQGVQPLPTNLAR